jgi:hypothetical protein
MSRRIPSYRRHKQSGQAIVTLTDAGGTRRNVLLGKWNLKAGRTEYARVPAEWLRPLARPCGGNPAGQTDEVM